MDKQVSDVYNHLLAKGGFSRYSDEDQVHPLQTYLRYYFKDWPGTANSSHREWRHDSPGISMQVMLQPAVSTAYICSNNETLTDPPPVVLDRLKTAIRLFSALGFYVRTEKRRVDHRPGVFDEERHQDAINALLAAGAPRHVGPLASLPPDNYLVGWDNGEPYFVPSTQSPLSVGYRVPREPESEGTDDG